MVPSALRVGFVARITWSSLAKSSSKLETFNQIMEVVFMRMRAEGRVLLVVFQEFIVAAQTTTLTAETVDRERGLQLEGSPHFGKLENIRRSRVARNSQLSPV